MIEWPWESELHPRELADSANQWDEKMSMDAKEHGKLWNFQRMLTQLLLPAISAYASATVRQTERNRLAQLTMAVRRFEHELHRWPESLDELLATNTELQSLRAANGEAFGFRLEPSGEAVIWGIYDSLANPIPAEPPRTDRVQDEDNVEWVWRLQHSPTSSAVVPLR